MKNESPLGNLDECEREPIQIPGAIQAHGVLITLRSSDYTILQISESVFDVLGVHHSELIHQPLSKLMPIESVERATKRLGDRIPRLLNPIPLTVEVRGRTVHLDGILHRSGRVLILELEKHVREEKGYGGFGGFYEAIREVTSKMMVTENLSEVLELACQELRKMTGFARVMAYKFDDDWNGEVVNESKDEDIGSYLHHHFPASDIPKQARDLYTTNWLRIIPNVNYKPSAVIPSVNPITDKPLDMSNSVLRSVSPLHLEYMRNMGQQASMSVSLLNGRKLWGLIACHNPEPLYLKYDVRVAAEFIGQMVSAQIIAREESHEVDHKLQLKKLYDDLLKAGGHYSSISKSFSQNSAHLLALVDAQGAALCFGDQCTLVGATPPLEEVEAVRKWLGDQKPGLVKVEQLLSLDGSESRIDASAAGILGISLASKTQDCILWFRPEKSGVVKWAGDPAAAKFQHAGRVHPRKSFETWSENLAGKSVPWRQPEIDAAEELRTSLLAMSTVPEEKTGDEAKGFRDSLASAIATTAATKQTREPSHTEVHRVNSASEAAQNSRLLLEGFAEFAVLFMDLDGCIQNWSAGAKRLLGYTKSQVLGQGLQAFFAEDDVLKEKHRRVLDHVRGHGRCEEEMWLYRQDQTSFWGKIMVAQVRNETNELIGFSIVIQDVTKEKAAEEELKATKLSAEAANRSKTAFLANISHEIRTPLGAVLGFAELMSGAGVGEQERLDLFGKVRRNGEQLTVLINDLLDISKVESGKIEIENIEIDLNSILADLDHLFTMKASEKGVRLSVQLDGAIPSKLVSDPTRLRQIVINLLSNAIKFTNSGGTVTLSVKLESMAQGRQLVFRVTDTGRGMTEAEMEKLFQPFVQADASTTRNYGGTGLGLFLSQRLARALGGDLSIEWSEPGKGTTFMAHIDPGDLSEVGSFTSLSPRSTSVAASTPTRNLEGVRVLVVDDSPDNRELLTTYLKKAGATVELADNGQRGVELALSSQPDVCLMDIQMPIVDGNQAMKMLKVAGYAKPVIALTAHAMKEERDFSLALGFKDYITKPIDRRLLIHRIFEMTRKS